LYKAFVIGCGNIGALYDLNNDQIQTHCKALYLDKRFSLSVFDTNKVLVRKIANKYQAEIIENIDEKVLGSFDCVSICSPTSTHYSLLKSAIGAGVKLIICEKPVSYNAKELVELKKLYKASRSKVIVNYIRRFQPAFAILKKRVSELLKKEELTNIAIRYQRGIVHNCSHAFDTIEYLTGVKMILTKEQLHNKVTDHFDNDPTLSLQALWGKTNVNIMGLSNVKFSHFEIELYFEYHRVAITNSGRTIEVYGAKKNKQYLQPLSIEKEISRDGGMNNYMKYVIDHAYGILSGKIKEDNFMGSVELNERMLRYIKK